MTLIDSETWPHVDLQLIVEIPSGSKVRYPDFVVSPLHSTVIVRTLGYCPRFPTPTSGTCLTYP